MSNLLGDHVFTAVQAWTKESPETKAAYMDVAKNLPTLIRFNGLVTAVAFVRYKAIGKKSEGAKGLLKDLFARKEDDARGFLTLGDLLQAPDAETGYQRLLQASGAAYRRMTHIAMTQAEWFKRFAESELSNEPPSDVANLSDGGRA